MASGVQGPAPQTNPNLSAAFTPTEAKLDAILQAITTQNQQFAAFLQSGSRAGWAPPTGAPGGPGGGSDSGYGGGPGGSGGSGSPSPTAGMTTSSGGGIGGAIYDRARSAPVVGWALAGYEEVVNQRDKNLQYQNVEGGSNLSGFGERAREEAYRWSTMGMMGSAEARKNFKGVTSLGYTNTPVTGSQGRQEALDFLYKGKSSYGQTSEEGLQALQVASKSADIDFKTLAGTLKEVAEAAGKAGVNAQMARTQFIATMDQAIKMGYGGGATAAANIVTQTAVSYGRGYAQTTDGSGRFSSSRTRLVASQYGMSYGQARQEQNSNPGAWFKRDAETQMRTLQQILGPNVIKFIQQEIDSYGGIAAIDESAAGDIGRAAAARFPGLDAEGLMNTIGPLAGQDFGGNENNMWTYVVKNIGGQGEGAMAQKERDKALRYDDNGNIMPGQGDSSGKKSSAPGAQARQRATGTGGKGARGGKGSMRPPDKKGSKTWDAYESTWADRGHSPAIDALLDNLRAQGKDPDKINVMVGGKVYNLSQAIDQFPDLVAAGQVEIMDQGLLGKSTGDIAGMKEEVDSATKKQQTAAAARGEGKSLDQWNTDTAGDKNKGPSTSGGAQVTIAPEAQWLLALKPDGTVPPADPGRG